jgi:hypothetical protein
MKDTKTGNSNLVSVFHSLGDETLKQTELMRNTLENSNETESLKSLASKLLVRNVIGNKTETRPENLVSRKNSDETEFEDYFKLFEERATRFENEETLPRDEAEYRAYLAILGDFIMINHPNIKKEFDSLVFPNKDKYIK